MITLGNSGSTSYERVIEPAGIASDMLTSCRCRRSTPAIQRKSERCFANYKTYKTKSKTCWANIALK
eukprot:scaffold25492_cov122-Cylindrotheca_fusiformis.AAC.2